MGRVIILEDNEEVINKVQQILMQENINFSQYDNTEEALIGEQALKRINELRYHPLYSKICDYCKQELKQNIIDDVKYEDYIFDSMNDEIENVLDKFEKAQEDFYILKIEV